MVAAQQYRFADLQWGMSEEAVAVHLTERGYTRNSQVERQVYQGQLFGLRTNIHPKYDLFGRLIQVDVLVPVYTVQSDGDQLETTIRRYDEVRLALINRYGAPAQVAQSLTAETVGAAMNTNFPMYIAELHWYDPNQPDNARESLTLEASVRYMSSYVYILYSGVITEDFGRDVMQDF